MESRLLARDLYAYLVELASELDTNGELEVAQQVRHVSQFVTGSSSELYGEARLILPRLADDERILLSEESRTRLNEVIVGIDREFRRIGGA